ncbi:hypothetical protein L1887_28789 [Cichorium endivia]|nr:hypothetical protein L1887_28789 [Cichorium endivia]
MYWNIISTRENVKVSLCEIHGVFSYHEEDKESRTTRSIERQSLFQIKHDYLVYVYCGDASPAGMVLPKNGAPERLEPLATIVIGSGRWDSHGNLLPRRYRTGLDSA